MISNELTMLTFTKECMVVFRFRSRLGVSLRVRNLFPCNLDVCTSINMVCAGNNEIVFRVLGFIRNSPLLFKASSSN